ncbi:hypothetical protein KIN20_032643 [Parelaphostrongylus tenuis]|uniref:Uncharacterized protein n=1 Tax=Parelaphostrongylus tenuis TaxID=148309 RepID=A0AAD5R7F7_PARTN|nr:hypothetical protein KIN20_032643 [Parelaphostrongylus tenuis]
MEPRLTAGDRTTERGVELQESRAGKYFATLADQMVQEFLVMELTEQPSARMAGMAGVGSVFLLWLRDCCRC